MSAPLFSVIIPTYGRPHFLAEAIGSVLVQTVDDFECLVVDDGSPATAAVPADPRFRLIRREQNRGPAAARNTGIRHARGRYLAFLDDDDLYVPTRLALALRGLRRAPVAICWTRFLHASRGSNRLLNGDVRDRILEYFIPHVGTTALERTAAPLFDERFQASEDAEWWLRVAHALQVATEPEVGYLQRAHDTPRHLVDAAARVEGRLLLLRLYAPYFAAHPRAAAFQWKRIAQFAASRGDFGLARRAFARSLALRFNLRTAWHLVMAFRGSRVPARGTGPLSSD